MPFSKRSVPSGPILGELLIGIFLLTSATPAQAGGTVTVRDVTESSYDVARERNKLFFGDEDSPDPVLLRESWAGGERINRFDDPENARQLAETLEGLEQALNRGVNQGRWLPFLTHDRKPTDPEILFGLEPATPQAPAASDSWKSRFHFRVSRGLEYRQAWPTGERDQRKLEMRISGPVVNDGLGMGFRLDGYVLDLPFQFKAYGGTGYDGETEAGITFDIKF